MDLSVCAHMAKRGLKLVEATGSTLLFLIQIIQFVHFVTFALVEKANHFVTFAAQFLAHYIVSGFVLLILFVIWSSA